MSTITTTGIGSGLDISGLVDTLVEAERFPEELRLGTIKETVEAKISAFGTIKSKLASVEDSLSSLKSMSTFTKRSVTSSSSSVLTGIATSTASLNSYEVTVTALAKTNSLYSAGFNSLNDTIGTGSLAVRFGTTVYDSGTDTYTSFTSNGSSTVNITVDSTNNTVTSMRDYINANDLGFSASIVDDGGATGNIRLVMTSDNSGVDNSIEVVVTDTGDANNTDTNGLSRLAFESNASNLQEGQAGVDAALTVNGISMTRASNTVVSAVDGVTMTLNGLTSGSSTVTLSVARDSEGIADDVNEFVDTYNEFITDYNAATAFDLNSGETGVLLGDATMANISRLLRNSVGSVVAGLDSDIRALGDLGIVANVDGTLGLTSSTLTQALANSLDDVGKMFAPIGVPTNANVTFLSNTASTVAATYAVAITQAATQGTLSGASVLPGTFGSVVVDGDNDNLVVRIDGTASANLSLTQGTYTSGASLAAEIQSKINGDSALSAAGKSVSVVYNDASDRFDISSAAFGSGSTVAVTSIDTTTAATLGFSAAGGTNGLNVVGTIDGTAATGVGRELVSTTGNSTGLKLFISSTTTGSLGDVVYTRGKATELDSILDAILDSDGMLFDQNVGFAKTLERAADDRVLLDYRMEQFEARLLAQFNVMDSLVASLQSTSSFLNQSLSNLPGFTNKNK